MLSTKDKLRKLVTEYVRAIRSENVDLSAIRQVHPNFEATTDASALTRQALQLAQDAFDPPHRYYFVKPPQDIPTHVFHLTVIDVESLTTVVAKGVDETNEYLKAVLGKGKPQSYYETMLFSCLQTIPVDFTVFESINDLCSVMVRVSRMNGCMFAETMLQLVGNNSSLAKSPFSGSISIGGQLVPAKVLESRALVFLLCALPAFDFNQQHRICTFCAVETTDRRGEMTQMLSAINPDSMRVLVTSLQENLSLQLFGGGGRTVKDENLSVVAEVIGLFNEVNYRPPNYRGIVPHTVFYNSTTSDFGMEEMKLDFGRRIQNKQAAEEGTGEQVFCFSDYPFLVDANFKSIILQFESIVDQQQAMRNAMFSMLTQRAGGEDRFFLVLRIQRNNLIESALRELNRKRDELRKPLRVKFQGEEGIDEGGVRKEFFQLICKELFDPNYGMFSANEKQRFLWIQPFISCNTCKVEFHLIGQTLGLAVFNNVILDVAFPKVIFRKLLGQPVDFDDLREIDPEYAAGLQDLLNFEESADATVEDIFCRTFVAEHEVFGETREVEIVPGGKNIPLTAANRNQFVTAMVQYVLVDAIKPNFDEFKAGFLSVCDSQLIRSLHPDELELLICGNPVLNFKELEESTRYDGFDKDDETIRLFWEVVAEFTPEQQKLFLRFCTGSDRVPIRGLKDLGFIIGKNGDEGELLPTAHTCFNHLLLPKYKSKELLRKQLLLAIENCTGFGLK